MLKFDELSAGSHGEVQVVSYYRKLWIGGMRKAAYPFV